MYLSRIVLKNIRGFKDLEFDFQRSDGSYAGWTVITGVNGSGKSTLLRAMAIGLDDIFGSSLLPRFFPMIRKGEEKASIQSIVIDERGKISSKKVGGNLEKISGDFCEKSSLFSVFSCGYGPFRRFFGASPEVMDEMSSPITERFVTLFRESASLSIVDSWLRGLKFKELEKNEPEKAQLALVMEILQDELLPGEITVDRVDSDGLWLKDRNGVELSWKEMSDGYRLALVLLLEILRHMIKFYGLNELHERNADGKIEIKRGGVVLIDEVDAHLHPEWQRQIGFWLTRHFPQVQFIVTSHSPIICQAATREGLIFVLPPPGSEEPARRLTDEELRRVVAAGPDTILLTPAFGLENTRSPEAVQARAQWAKLMGKKKVTGVLTEEEQKKVDELGYFILDEE